MHPADLLDHLLQRLDSALPDVDLLTAEEIGDWPKELLDCLLAQDILVPAPPASTTSCDSCWEEHAEEVQVVPSSAAVEPRYYIPCPTYGRVQVDPEVLRRWRVDGSGLTRTVAQFLDCQDQCREIIGSRLWYLGTCRLRSRTWDAYLARGLAWPDAEQVLALAHRLPQLESAFVLSPVTPRAAVSSKLPVVPLSQITKLDGGNIDLDRRRLTLALETFASTAAVAPSAPAESLIVDAPQVPSVTLSSQEQEEFRRQGFKSDLAMQVTGRMERRNSNEVIVAGTPVMLPGAEFLLFLRLVVGLFESESGFVSEENLCGDGESDQEVYCPPEIHRAVYRLRRGVKPVLQGLDGNKFIEHRNKRVRLSTHRRYVIADRSRLLNHPDGRIRDLACRLPEVRSGSTGVERLGNSGTGDS